MPNRSVHRESEQAWVATKLAVRRYSRDPSEANAAEVRSACLRLRDLPAAEGAPPKGAGAEARKASVAGGR